MVKLGIIPLIVAITLMPRIPLGIIVPGKTFDLRGEDIILIILVFLWLINLCLKPKFYTTSLFTVIGFYVIVVIFTTGIALMTINLSVIRTFFYFLKEVEYFLIFLFIANWIHSESELKIVLKTLLFTGILNAFWVGYQLITHQNRSLFMINTELSQGVYRGAHWFESYGPHLISESSPLSTGGFFMLVFLLSFTFYLFSNAGIIKKLFAVLSVTFFISCITSFSRVSILGAVIGAAVLLRHSRLKIKSKIIPLLLIVLVLASLYIYRAKYILLIEGPLITNNYEIAETRLSVEGFKRVINERINIWEPIIKYGFKRPFRGYGKGSLAFLEIFPADPHNYYIRVFIEAGLLGLGVFILLLVAIISLSLKVIKKSERTLSKIIGCVTLAATVGFCIGAIFEDIFQPVLLNELWWIFIGLTVAVYRIENNLKKLSINKPYGFLATNK